jgi:hypothetical protein
VLACEERETIVHEFDDDAGSAGADAGSADD